MRLSNEPNAAPLLHLSLEIAEKELVNLDAGIAVSVIIPCFDSAGFLRPCLESLRLQTLPQHRFEVICVDDCSTDDTLAILAEYEGKIANLRIIRHEVNRKQGAARNTGIDAARGDYVLFLDSDDFLRVDAVEVLLNLIGTADVAVCQHITTRFDKTHKRTVSNRHVKTTLSLAALENTVGWWPFGMLISRALLSTNNIRFREGVYFEDIDFNITVFLNAQSHVLTKEALYWYIERDGSTVNSMTERKLRDSAAAIGIVTDAAHRTDHAEQEAFYKKASNWLLLQATRLRDSDNTPDEKHRLAHVFVADLRARDLLTKLEAGLAEKIILAATTGTVAAPAASAKAAANFRYNPWPKDFRGDFAGKVIFFCEVNYHIRSVAPIARILKQRGIDSIVIDASKSTNFTSNRPLPEDELPLYADIDLRPFNVAEVLPFSTDAGAFVFMNDTTYTKRLIFENFGFGVPTFGFYEGINDDWNLDRKASRMPYRSVDYILLPGIYQQGFYADRECRIVGLPNVRNRLALPYVAPTVRRAVINVNFTYGVLEDRRDTYVESAVQACQEIGLDYIITQHPADKADLSRFNVGKDSVYNMLDEGSLMISRFSTTILESLAIGRPAVYHNPIGEKVPKFHHPLGAFSTSHDVESLKRALRREMDFVDGGGDVRARASLFLHFHSHSGAELESDVLAADCIAAVLADPPARFAFKLGKRDFEPGEVHAGAQASLRLAQGATPASDTQPELAQLRENFKALSAFAAELEQRVGQGAASLPPGADVLARLAAATDPESARMLLTTVGSGILLKQDAVLDRLKADKTLQDGVERALSLLPETDAHRVQFLRVRQRAG